MSSKLPILEAYDDGLQMRPAGEWTYDKLYYLNAYIGRFIVSMRKKLWRAIQYIDLFAGPGKNQFSNGKIVSGSPLLALSQKQSFDHYFFSDIEPSYIELLNRRCLGHLEYKKITFLTGDANQVVDLIIKDIEETDAIYKIGAWPSLNLAFLDPDGLELHWMTVEKLASRRTDLIIYYPQMGITRDAPKEIVSQPPTPIDHFFGDANWRRLYRQYQKREESFLHRILLDHYKQKLTSLGYIDNRIVEPLMKNSKEAPLYRLLFACKHALGYKFWANVTKDLPSGQMRLL
jgi:three-Cys-motif partner protein